MGGKFEQKQLVQGHISSRQWVHISYRGTFSPKSTHVGPAQVTKDEPVPTTSVKDIPEAMHMS